jgi:AcrR family transcriptional regulator
MMNKGQTTRARLMDIAETSILDKGFAATSIEELIAEAGITKSGFFYHFPDKNALALELLKRYIEREDILFDDLLARARELHEDPLHAFLIGLKLLAELLADMPNGHPGCLVATYCYNERMFDREVRDLYKQAVLNWRTRFRAILDEVVAAYPPRENVDLDMLADMVNSTVEGGIVMAKALGEPKLVAEQVLLFRSYIRLLFEPAR